MFKKIRCERPKNSKFNRFTVAARYGPRANPCGRIRLTFGSTRPAVCRSTTYVTSLAPFWYSVLVPRRPYKCETSSARRAGRRWHVGQMFRRHGKNKTKYLRRSNFPSTSNVGELLKIINRGKSS